MNNLAGNAISGAFGVNSAVTVQTVAPGVAATLDPRGLQQHHRLVVRRRRSGRRRGHRHGDQLRGRRGDADHRDRELAFVPTTTSYGGKITNTGGALSVVINGAGAQSLSSGASTYTGGTTLNSGTLDIDASGVGGPWAAPVSGPLGKGALTTSGGNIGTGIGTGANNTSTISNAVTVNASFGVTNVVLPVGTLGAPNTATVSPPNGPSATCPRARQFQFRRGGLLGSCDAGQCRRDHRQHNQRVPGLHGDHCRRRFRRAELYRQNLFVHWQRQRRRSAQYLQGHDDRGRCGSRCGHQLCPPGQGRRGLLRHPREPGDHAQRLCPV